MEMRGPPCQSPSATRWVSGRLSCHVPVRHTKNPALALYREAVLLIKRDVFLLVRLEVRPRSVGIHSGTKLRHYAATDTLSLTIGVNDHWAEMPMRLRRVTPRPFGYPFQDA